MDNSNNLKKENNLFLDKILSKISNFSLRTIAVFSTFTSGYMSYKYLKNKEIYSEFNGHFNSPNNLHNRRLTFFYLQEALVRFSLGTAFILGISLLVSKVVLKNYTKQDQRNNTNTEIIISKVKNDELVDSKILKLNEYQMCEDNQYELDELLSRKRKVENYINK
jgi:hypothetical protein